MNKTAIWAAFSLVLLGCWLLSAPATFGYHNLYLTYSDWISGALLIILGLACRKRSNIGTWLLLIIGVWLQAAPLVFSSPDAACYVNDTLVGIWVIVLSFVIVPFPQHDFATTHNVPMGWSYNPSSWAQRLPAAFFAFVCWLISRYLAAFQLGYIDTVWDPFFVQGTYKVLTSDVSKAFPVSDAGLGAFAYTMEFISAVQGDTARWRRSPWIVMIFGILVIPVSIVSTTLIILQPLVVKSWCTLCLITAICMLFPIGFAIDEVIAVFQYMRRIDKKSRLKVFFVGGECPLAKDDTRSPSLDEPLMKVIKASAWGVTFPLNLIITAALGIWMMVMPSYFSIKGLLFDLDPILGAFVVITSVMSFGEMVRKARYLNIIFALALGVFALMQLSGIALLAHILTASAIILFSFRQGSIKEKFHSL